MGSCAAPSAKGDDKFITTDYLQQCLLNCQELAAQQPLRPINWCSRLLKMTIQLGYSST
uniref:TniB NTP-binding protein n=1 Tax=Escherichia coli TaxID=562 RepID=A0A3G1QCD7_ECOLX|nr:TniB NTP-binding protein [Escherichia coli]